MRSINFHDVGISSGCTESCALLGMLMKVNAAAFVAHPNNHGCCLAVVYARDTTADYNHLSPTCFLCVSAQPL
ncbi:hypothetical protein Plhal304r1_c019g0068611 [Plasmopara halstedii]